MDLLLTPLVSKFLRQYVKRSAEGAGSDLKVSFTRGNVLTLHNLELNLAPLLGGAAALAHVRRAFARRLSITIPWTALTSQPIQVVLDTVELVLSAADQSPAPTPVMSASTLQPSDSEANLSAGVEDDAVAAAAAAAATGGGGSGSGGGSWLGSALQSMALRAGLNVTVQLSNVVLKWVQEGDFVAAATFQQLLLQTSADDWREGRQNPEAWLKKELSIKQLSLSLDQHDHRSALRTPAPTPRDSASALAPVSPQDGAAAGMPSLAASRSGTAHTYQPVLRVASLRASALLPAFAWLEGADLAGEPFNSSVDVQLSPLHVAVNDRQLQWAGHLAALMQAAAMAKRAAAAAEAEAAAAAASAAARLTAIASHGVGPPGTPRPPGHVAAAAVPGSIPVSPAVRPSPPAAAGQGLARPQTKALGVFGRVWDFLVDEATYLEAAEGSSPAAASQQPGSPLAATPSGEGVASPRQQGAPPTPPASALQAVPMHAELQVVLEELHVTLGVVEDAGQHMAITAAGELAGGQPGSGQEQQLAMPPDLAATLEQLRAATASNSVEAAAALQQQLAAALSAAGAGAPGAAQAAGSAAMQRAAAHPPRYRVHQFAELYLGHLQVAVASMDASISGVAVELRQLSLRRSAAAVPLLSHLLEHSRRSDSNDSEQHTLAAAAAAAASAGSGSWVDVVLLEADGQLSSPAAAPHLSPKQQARARLAVSFHFFDQAARPGAHASSSRAPHNSGQLQCTVAVGRMLVAHAPGFLTHLRLFAGQYSAAASVSPFSGGHLPGGASNSSSSSLQLPAGSPAPSRAASPARPGQLQPTAAAVTGGGSEDGDAAGDAASKTKPLLAQTLLPQVQLEWRVSQLELAALSSEASSASAVVLLLRQLELRSGALSWDAPGNAHLRHTLLAPPLGFNGHGLRLSLASATLGVTDLPAGSVPGDGLWQLRQAVAVSTAVQVDAVVCADPASASAAAGAAGPDSSGSSGMQVAAAVSPLQLHASCQQVAVLAQVAAAVSTELGARFSASLVAEQPNTEQAERQPWLANLSLNLATGVQLAYASSGGLQHWRHPHMASGTPQPASSSVGGSSGPAANGRAGFEVRLGSTMLAVAFTPGTAATAAAAAPSAQPGGLPGHQHQPHLVLQAQLEETQLVLQPQLAVRLPVVEVRLGSAADLAAPAMLAEPLVLASGISCQRQSRAGEEAAPEQQRRRRTFNSTAVRCGSLAVAVSAADYPLLLGVLRCVRQQPALPPRPVLLAGSGTATVQQSQLQQVAGSIHVPELAAAEEQEQGSELTVELDGACVSVWPHLQHQPQTQPQQRAPQPGPSQHCLAVRLCKLRLRKQQSVAAGVVTSVMDVSLASAHVALKRHQHQQTGADIGSAHAGALEWSPVLTFPAAATRQPGLTLTLRGSSTAGGGVVASSPRHGFSPSKGPPGGQRLQLQAAPVSLALSSELLAATAAISRGISSTAGAMPAGGEQPDAGQLLAEDAALAAAEAAAMQGKAALQGVRLVLAEAASWTDKWPAGHQQQQPFAPGAGPSVAVDIEEAVLLLQRSPAAENRPWLAGGGTQAAGSLLTAVDASLIGAAITVHHTGLPGADATALLPPTDGSVQVLLQPQADSVSVALNAQLLPLQISVPAVSAVSSVLSALFFSAEDDEQQEQQQQQQLASHPHSQLQQQQATRGPAPSPAAVAAAATVIIEDAAATLQPHGRGILSGAATAASGQHEPVVQQPSDDLVAALFTLVHSSGLSSRPAPLQVHTFDSGPSDPRSSKGETAGLGARLWAAASGGGGRGEAQQPGGAAQGRWLQGIRWCYTQAREVALIAVEHAPMELLAATFQLSWYCEEAGQYLAVPLQAYVHDQLGSSGGSTSGKTLLLVAEEPSAAAEWQLSWEIPASSSLPAALVTAVSHRLRINPRGGVAAAAAAAALQRQVWLPPPLAASLTVILTGESSSLSLLAPAPLPLLHGQGASATQQGPEHSHQQLLEDSSAPPSALLDAVAVLHLGNLKAALHSYPSPEGTSLLAGDLQAQLALCLPDSSSAVAPAGTLVAAGGPGAAVVQPFLLDCAVEYSSCGDSYHLQQQPVAAEHLGQQQRSGEGSGARSSSGGGGGSAQQQLPFWQAQAAHQPAELPLLAVRVPPANRGLAFALSAQHQPVVVNASEALLAEVRHILAALSANPADGTAGGNGLSAAPKTPLLLVNNSGVALRVRQEGASEHGKLLLLDGQRQHLLWPAPPPLVPGAVRRLQLAPASAAEDDETAWSAPVDVMASGGHAVLLPATGRSSSSGRSLAAQVRPSSCGGGWEVVLRPGMRAVNHLSVPVHFCLTHEGWDGSNGGIVATAPAQQRSPQRHRREQHNAIVLSSGLSTDLRLPGDGALLRLFLGGGADGSPGAGWSQALSLPQQQQALMVLHSSPAAAATATAAGLDSPPEAAGQTPLGSVLAQLLPPDEFGQTSLHFWPPLLLHNSTPCKLRLLLPAAAAQQPLQEVVLLPGGSRQLAVRLQGGPVGSLLALGPAEAERSDPAALATAVAAGAAAGGSSGLAIIVPPLIAESAEQKWFGASPLQAAAQSPRGKPPPAVYIAPPGQATGLRLPLLLPGGQESAFCSPAAVASAASLPAGVDGKGTTASTVGGSCPAASAADCVLVTQHRVDGLPCMQLSLLPALVVHNCLPVPMLFQVPGAAAVEVPAGQSLPLAVSGSGLAAEAVVALRVPGGSSWSGSSGGSSNPAEPGQSLQPSERLLQSQPFSLDCSEDAGAGAGSAGVPLLLRPKPSPAPARNGSRGFWGGSGGGDSVDGSGSQSQAVECRLSARVEARSYPAADGAAVESISVTVTAGCFVSNLTGLPLAMLAEGVAAGQVLPSTAAGNSSSQPATLLQPSATVPLMHVWRAGGEGGKRSRHQRQSSWSSGDMLRTFSGGLLPSPASAQPAAATAGGGPGLRFALAAQFDPSEGGLPTPQTNLQQGPSLPADTSPHVVPLSEWSARLRPYDAAGRQRLYLQQHRGGNFAAAAGSSSPDAEGSDGSLVMLTYRVLLSGGCFHLVLFRDRQPPFVVQNATGCTMDVGYFPASEAADGSFSYAAAPRSALRVGPGHTLECDFQPSRSRTSSSSAQPSSGGGSSSGDEGGGLSADGPLSPVKRGSSTGGASGGWEDQEDEDAFLDCLLREELRAAGQEQQRPPPVLKFRPAGGREWLHPCILLPGLHAAASASSPQATSAAGALGQVHISRCCATTRILLLPPAGKPQGAAASCTASPAQAGIAAEAEQPRPLRLDVSVRELQLCMWDDERQRLLPAAGGGEAEAHGGSLLGEELFCLSLDQLHLHLSRQLRLEVPAGAASAVHAVHLPQLPFLHPWQRQPLLVSTAWLAAGGVQLDSFLPGSEQPVLLTSLPEDSFEGMAGTSSSRRPGPPLQLGLVVHHCPAVPGSSSPAADPAEDGSSGGSMSFRNAWVHDLLVQLPTLAVAADDALLLFADRASAMLLGGSTADGSSSSGSSDDGASLEDGREGSAAQEQQAQQVAGGSHQEPAAPLAQLQQSLAAEALGAAASRLYIEQAAVESVRLLLDAHITAGTAGVPVAVDTHRAPVTLSRIAAHDVLFRPHILVRGLMAHGVAEALLNAPQVLGSLSLLFNPTGLVRSVRAGVGDLIGLPLAALQNQSLSQFISGVGLGSVSLVKHTLGWTLTSISGFSQAFARAVDSAVAIRSTSAAGGAAGSAGSGTAALAHRPPPAHLGHGLSQGVASLAEGVAAGITGVVSAPVQGYSSGSGVLGGLARGLLGAVGLPVSGALELVGAVSAGLASSAGVVYVPQPRREGRTLALAPPEAAVEAAAADKEAQAAGRTAPAADALPPPAVVSAARLMQHPALLAHRLDGDSSGLGRYLAHTPVASSVVLQGAQGLRAAHFAAGFALQQPVLLVADAAVLLFSSGGLEAVLVLPLAQTEVEVRYSSQEIRLFSRRAAPAGQPGAAAPAAVLCRLSREAWLRVAPLLRRRTAGTLS